MFVNKLKDVGYPLTVKADQGTLSHPNELKLHIKLLRHGPFDILGGGAWVFFEKNFLALILAKKIILLNGTVKKIICLQ